MKILIPMAGEGSRFKAEGYTFPKPLIDVAGKPMIQRVVENFDFGDEYIFLVRKSHLIDYEGMEEMLHRIVPSRANCRIVEVNKLTEGAACTAMLARDYIDNSEELLIVNSDQIIEFSKENFQLMKLEISCSSIVFTFKSTHPKWSFVKINPKFGDIVEIAEKKPISDVATCGAYWFKEGEQFCWAVDRMIEKNERVNNEFYIAPALNWFCRYGKAVYPFFVHEMHGLGTPEDLRHYLEVHK